MEPNQPKGSRRFVTTIISLIIVLGLTVGGYVVYKNVLSCTFPVEFSVGNVDSRFKISSSEVEKVAKDAASRWNKADSKDLLQYNPNAKLKINLVYDQRQAELDALNTELDKIKSTKSNLDSQNQKFNDFLSSYQSKLNSYNAEVQKWNSQGGAPPEVFTSLEAQRKELEQMQATLKQMAEVFNLNANSYNNDLTGLNDVLNQKKDEIVTKGEYSTKNSSIDIYTFGSEDELRLVLIHELGHALGGDHVQNSQAIMHDVLDLSNLKDPSLTQDDLNDINQTCSARLNYNSSRYLGYLNHLLPNLQ